MLDLAAAAGLEVLAGARVLDVYPVLPLVANEPLGVGALSYAGGLTIGIAADPDVYPDLDILCAAIRDELRNLGLPTLPPLEGSVLAAPARPTAAASARSAAPRAVQRLSAGQLERRS